MNGGTPVSRYDDGLEQQIVTPAPAASAAKASKLRSWAFIFFTNILSIACLWWVLSDAELHAIWGEIRNMDWRWVSVAVIFDVMVYLWHGVRWKLLLMPVQPISFFQAVRSIYVGLFANEVLPLRAGELIRCFLLSRWTKIPLSVTFASALIERIFDGIWLLAFLFVSLQLSELPGALVKGGYALAIIIALLAVVIAIAMYAKQQSFKFFNGVNLPAWFNTLIEDLQLIGHSRYLYFSALASGGYLLTQFLPIYAVARAYGLDVPWTASFALLVLLRLSSIVPQAPGNLGSFQWVTARTLILFGVAEPLAKRFSLILWAVVTIPLIVVGFIALLVTGIKMTHLHREAKEAASRGTPAAAGPIE